MDEREIKQTLKKLKTAMQLPYEYAYAGTIRSVPQLSFSSLNSENKLFTLADDTNFPPPTAYGFSENNLIESDMNVAGHTMGAVVRESFVRIILLWNYLSNNDIEIIEGLDFPLNVRFCSPGKGFVVLEIVKDSPRNIDLVRQFLQPTRQSNGKNWVSLVLVEAIQRADAAI